VATNVELVRTELLKIAQMAHDGLARAVRPSHTIFDGDIIFAVSLPDPAVKAKPPVSAVGAAGAKVFAQAIVKGIKEARSIPGFPAKRDLKP
jgi:L-aminopeptidase/D-esterase-like protein